MAEAKVPLELNYRIGLGDFTEIVSQIELENLARIDSQFAKDIAIINEGLNLLYGIASHYVWLMTIPNMAQFNKANDLIFSACHKNQVALYTSLKLTRIGLTAPRGQFFVTFTSRNSSLNLAPSVITQSSMIVGKKVTSYISAIQS